MSAVVPVGKAATNMSIRDVFVICVNWDTTDVAEMPEMVQLLVNPVVPTARTPEMTITYRSLAAVPIFCAEKV